MTINKVQEQTSHKITLGVRKDVFNHGQLCASLSKVRSYDSLKVYVGSHRNPPKIKNLFYKEIFQLHNHKNNYKTLYGLCKKQFIRKFDVHNILS